MDRMDEMWLQAEGVIEINNGIRINLGIDFCKYYQWLLERYLNFTRKYQLPKYKAHITIVNPKIHKVYDYSPVAQFAGQLVKFDYSVDGIFSPVNYWLPVRSDIEGIIKNRLNVIDDPSYLGLHITICNRKFA